ncbi:MAG: ribulose bisphosphate carboxylase small subunit [bacterium]
MHLAPSLNFSPTKMDTVRQTVNNALLYDWAIRVEYMSADAEYGDDWQQWEKPLFALDSAQEVLDAITDCHTSHPHSSIRLSAQKLRPRTHILLCVHNAGTPVTPGTIHIDGLYTPVSPRYPTLEDVGLDSAASNQMAQ